MSKDIIAFSPPPITEDDIEAVVKVLRSGWITTGPVTSAFEEALARYSHVGRVLCLSSATWALEIALRLFGVKAGDEVIVPAYTYTASANVVLHIGATVLFADVQKHSFLINPLAVVPLLSPRTKVIMAVDVGGASADYDGLKEVIEQNKNYFIAESPLQEQLGQILLLSDAAHSLGSSYKGVKAASVADMTAFSFHAVKNLTTAEGGALCLNSIGSFSADMLYKEAKMWSLHGQNKDALAKNVAGSWQYDILFAGYKCNMTDIQAALGLSQLTRYEESLTIRREKMALYHQLLDDQRFIFNDRDKMSSSACHLCMLRIASLTENQRDAVITKAALAGISLNVHFKPLPLLSCYRHLGYGMANLQNSYNQYANEISLPLYTTLNTDQIYKISSFIKSIV